MNQHECTYHDPQVPKTSQYLNKARVLLERLKGVENLGGGGAGRQAPLLPVCRGQAPDDDLVVDAARHQHRVVRGPACPPTPKENTSSQSALSGSLRFASEVSVWPSARITYHWTYICRTTTLTLHEVHHHQQIKEGNSCEHGMETSCTTTDVEA